MKRQWFRIENSTAAPNVAEIQIIDVIGSWDDDWFARNFGYDLGVTARAFVEALAALPESVDTLHVHINSPGGDVQGGINIANALRAQQTTKGRTVVSFVDGIAASIASVIAMAGTRVVMADNALMMVHNPWGGAIGDSAEMRKTADVLDKMRGQIVDTYRWHSSLSAEDLTALMDSETWMNADEAISAGLATEKVAAMQAAASLDPRGMAHLRVPDRYRASVDAFLKKSAEPPPAPGAASALDVVAACDAAQCSELVKELLTAGATLDQVQARILDATQQKAAAAARSTEITALCKAANMPTLADDYIAGGMPVALVKNQLTIITAKQDVVEIDASLKATPSAATKAAADLSPSAIYARRNPSTTKKES